MRPARERTPQAERELVAAILARDRKAIAEFVQLYADEVHAFVWRRLFPHGEAVDDVTQETFLAAWRALPDFRGTSPLKGWLLGIARHKVEDHYRRKLREPETIDAMTAEPAESAEVEAGLDRTRDEQVTMAILSCLPEDYACVLRWRYWDQVGTRDIAARTGRTEKSVERLLARARDHFRREWEARKGTANGST